MLLINQSLFLVVTTMVLTHTKDRRIQMKAANVAKGGITLRVHLTPDGPIAAKLHSLSANGCV